MDAGETTRTATAAKRGRFAAKPYVPVVAYCYVGPKYAAPKKWTTQVRPYAFATRAEAIAYARRFIEANT